MSKLSRKSDLAYLLFLVVHIPITILIDTQHLWPQAYVPTFARNTLANYIKDSNDPFVGNPYAPHLKWFESFLLLEVFFQVPCFVLGAWGLYTNNKKFYPLLLAYSASSATTTFACLYSLFFGGHTLKRSELTLLLQSYIPFLLVAFTMAVDMANRIRKSIITSTRPVKQKLLKRPSDLIHIVCMFFYVPGSLLINPQFFLPASVFPKFARKCLSDYIQQSADPAISNGTTPEYAWFRAIVLLLYIFYLPAIFIGGKGLIKNDKSVYPLLLAYGASNLTSIFAVMFTAWHGTFTGSQWSALLQGQLPFVFGATFLTFDMYRRVYHLVSKSKTE